MKQKEVLVSVVIPVYGVEKYLDRCLESVIAQTYPHLEIILVDDGSPDNCPAMCDDWAKKDSRIKVIHKENGGLTSARKAGFKRANGEYIIFFDSDDYVEHDMIEKLLDAARESGQDVTMCSWFADNGKQLNPIRMGYTKNIIEKSELRDEFILPIIAPLKGDVATNGFIWTKLFKATKLKDDFFVSEREYYTEDIVFNANLALDINGIAIVNTPMYHYCLNPDSLTLKYRELKYEITKKRAAYFEAFFKKNGWQDITERRTTLLKLYSVLLGVDNEVLLDDFKLFKNRCRVFRNDAKREGILKLKNTRDLVLSQKITLILLSFRLYHILFFYRKKRVGV